MEQIKAILMGSPEYFVNRGGGTRAGFAAALFHDVFGTPIDPHSRAVFTRLLAGGMTRTALARLLLQSNRADVVLAAGFYREFLHRAADPLGLKSCSRALALGVRDDVIVALMEGSPAGLPHTLGTLGKLERLRPERSVRSKRTGPISTG